MESDEIHNLTRLLEEEKRKSKKLKHQLKIKQEQQLAQVIFTENQRMVASSAGALELQRRLQSLNSLQVPPNHPEIFHNFIEREEENITNTLQKVLHNIIKEKVELESVLEQEQEYIVNSMSRQVAQTLAEKLEFKRRAESEHRSRSVSDVDSTSAEESITDSSFSSDSESGRELGEKRRLKLLETELACSKEEMRLAKREVRKYKELYEHLVANEKKLIEENYELGKLISESEGEKEGDTDRSDFSIESSSSRGLGLDSSQEIPELHSRETSQTPKKQIAKK